MPPPPHSTRLENIRLEPDGAQFDLEGRNVRLRQETDPGSLAALRAFYDGALSDAAREPPVAAKPGLFARLRSWLGRVFSDPIRIEPPLLGAPVSPPPHVPTPPPPPPRPAEAGPQLRAVFGDPQGVHVLWHSPGGKSPERTFERRYPADSELGRRLQDCYGHLAQMGYQIVGLNLQPIEPGGPVREASGPAAEKPAPAAALMRSAPAPEVRKAPEAKPPTWVVRLLPEASDHPGRALTTPFVCVENVQPLAAPDRLIRALRTAADPSAPVAESLTCLRCTLAKTGLKVVAVGLGQDRTGEPARWEDIGPWLDRQPEPAEEKKPRPGPTLRPAEPELGL